jgi:hypothetical protein
MSEVGHTTFQGVLSAAACPPGPDVPGIKHDFRVGPGAAMRCRARIEGASPSPPLRGEGKGEGAFSPDRAS